MFWRCPQGRGAPWQLGQLRSWASPSLWLRPLSPSASGPTSLQHLGGLLNERSGTPTPPALRGPRSADRGPARRPGAAASSGQSSARAAAASAPGHVCGAAARPASRADGQGSTRSGASCAYSSARRGGAPGGTWHWAARQCAAADARSGPCVAAAASTTSGAQAHGHGGAATASCAPQQVSASRVQAPSGSGR